jgi:hypothetical protein
VNDFTVNLNAKGREAIEFFLEKLKIINVSNEICKPVFVEIQNLLT